MTTPPADVCVVGAGPAGLMLGTLLTRFGVKTEVLDDRPNPTAVGRADGIQPKTIETFQMMGLGDDLLRDGVRVYDICLWRGSKAAPLQRMSREVHYPADCLDVKWPFILLCHQGMIEGLLLDDLHDGGGRVQRSKKFASVEKAGGEGEEGENLSSGRLAIACEGEGEGEGDAAAPLRANYLVGCDGARSRVRAAIPDTYAQGTPHRSAWGVLDGELDTDFPDIWSKAVVFSEEHGTVLMIPRERNMTRFYIELQVGDDHTQETVMQQAQRVLQPYRCAWRSVEWFGHYTVAQRVAARFMDPEQSLFIAGDASHTHSPKAAQGMNTSVHDAWNLAWKLNLAVRGLARPALLASYEEERKKIALDLIHFDYEHANQIAGGDAAALAANFRTNVQFISGVGVEYGTNTVIQAAEAAAAANIGAVPGRTLPPATATRYIDANPVDLQLDIPVLGQFRIYVVVPDLVKSAAFLTAFSAAVEDTTSSSSSPSFVAQVSAAAAASYAAQPRPRRSKDVYVRPERYTGVSELFTFALITGTDKKAFEVGGLPSVFARSPWTVYLDDVPQLDTRGETCTHKWLGGLGEDEVAVLNVRPDGYVGSVRTWPGSAAAGTEAAGWLDAYYGGFLKA